MMASLKNMLEPGETVVAVSPPLWPIFPIGLYLFGMILTSALIVSDVHGLDLVSIRIALGLLTTLGLGLTVFLGLMMRWRIAVTDRRVLIREGFLRRKLTEIPLDIVDSITHHDFTVEIRGGGHTIAIKLHPLLADRILALLDTGSGARGRYVGPFGRIPEPGERVLFKNGGKMLLAMCVAMLLPAFLVVVLLLALANSALAVINALQIGAAFFALWGFSTSGLVIAEKRWVVTDRRILSVTGLLYRRIEDLPLNSDTEATLDETALTVRSGDRVLTLSLENAPEKRGVAVKIHEAVARAKCAT